jgi:GNAT superfamily N-acetyltransferase
MPRRAVVADSARLAALGRASFIETFGYLYPAADLKAFLDTNHAPERYAEWIGDPSRAVWIAEHEGEAVAYAYAGPCALPHPDVTPECGELKRLYLLKSVQGLGLGARLLDAALEHLTRPDRRLWIGVWSENRRAQRLYERRGFKKVGEYLFPVGETLDREFILRL